MPTAKKIIISVLLILTILASAVLPGISAYLSAAESHSGIISIDETYFEESNEEIS